MNNISFTSNKNLAFLMISLMLLAYCDSLEAHGSVTLEEDMCLLEMGYTSAHFKIYQTTSSGHDQYCEDIPYVAESIFVMEYLHDSLKEIPIEFRIIKDITSLGRFAKWDDLKFIDINKIELNTVFYQAPIIKNEGIFTIMHSFKEPGNYIGIVSIENINQNLIYNAVFPFKVGNQESWHWILFLIVVVIIQINYMIMSGNIYGWKKKIQNLLRK
tara:strand:+ start:1189 stop:1833 length:645 start_codon:yes stop_codon:yes gene_type:complete